MIHLIRHDKGQKKGLLDIVITGQNGKVLHDSHGQGFKKREGVYYNLRATAKNFNHPSANITEISFQDDTGKVGVLCSLPLKTGRVRIMGKTKSPKYIPGRNPKKKK